MRDDDTDNFARICDWSNQVIRELSTILALANVWRVAASLVNTNCLHESLLLSLGLFSFLDQTLGLFCFLLCEILLDE